MDTHLEHLTKALTLLKQHQLFVKLSKCKFGCSKVEYLGHIISVEGVCADQGKIQAMTDWPLPKTAKALRGFLGLTGYYRKFIKGYGSIAAPLTAMLRHNYFTWTDLGQEAFQALKKAVSQTPFLALPNFFQPFLIECDASGVGIRAVLMQSNRPIAFLSKALKGKALHMSVYEKELFALVTTIYKWRPYLLGKPFVVRTDQQCLKFLLEQKVGTPFSTEMDHQDARVRLCSRVQEGGGKLGGRCPIKERGMGRRWYPLLTIYPYGKMGQGTQAAIPE